MTNIPDWLKNEEKYSPQHDKESFVNRSTKAVIGTLSRLKGIDTQKAKESNISLRLLGIFVIIILTSLSHNFSFVLLMITLMLIKIATLKAGTIRTLVATILPILLISTLILLPSIFLGNPKTPLTIFGKIFVCTSIVLTLNLTTNFNEITRGLKAFFVPDIIIFTLDLTIKYIFILGETCSKMLTALKTRSIGKNNQKSASTSGILGTLFIKAKSSVDETSKAMECRGFNGKYTKQKQKLKLNFNDIFNVLLFIFIAFAFAYLEAIL